MSFFLKKIAKEKYGLQSLSTELSLEDMPDYGIPDQKHVEEWIVNKKAALLRAKLNL